VDGLVFVAFKNLSVDPEGISMAINEGEGSGSMNELVDSA
jgi:hypothetical protein